MLRHLRKISRVPKKEPNFRNGPSTRCMFMDPLGWRGCCGSVRPTDLRGASVRGGGYKGTGEGLLEESGGTE